MAAASLSTYFLPDLAFLRPDSTRRLRVSLSRISLSRGKKSALSFRARVQREEFVVEERERESVSEASSVELNGNGNGSVYGHNGAVERYTNGSVGVIESENGAINGSLVKYVNGNGSASRIAEEVVESEAAGRKKTIEEIGQEEAWFKSSGQKKLEVSVAPGGRWNRFRTYSTIQRTLEIWGSVLTFIFKAWLNNQKFSYREDQVPPFPSDTAISIVEEELEAPVNDIFERFDYEPIAAASLGQVHRAKLKGKEVVIKVQRPGLKDLFDIDLKNLRVIAEYLQKVDPKSDGAKRDWVAIYDECANVLYQEIDYTKEAANAELFANNFRNMDYVKVPTIFWEYTTPQVLTMEYVPGIKINRTQALDQLGVDRQRLSRYAVESYLEQILSHGFFHADPHPGNIAVDDFNGGRLIFYDFGMMGSISPNIREGLLEVFYGVYEKDPEKVLQAMVQMGVLVPTGDMTAVRRTAMFFLNSFEERLVAQRKEREMAKQKLGFKKPLSKEERIEKKKQRLAAIGEDLLSIAADQPFRFPATFTFVVRAFSVLDGIGKGLDPRFDITEIAKPYALELLRFREAGIEVILKDFRKRWDCQSRAFYNLFRQAERVEKLAEVIQRLEQGDLKLRVRALESERAFQRVAAVQKTIGSAVAAGTLVNLATILYLNSIRVPSMVAYTFCAFFGFQVLFGLFKVKKLDQRERLITGTA
ncbi:UbiB domain protein [Actinidia chinensis var. chinensis]|uniref:UbiB domain protein n=1 Tax=Actinidia chinensis var. chinensis TaxID=1590841 RepID=A0A2R6R686_ACTCC|nr:UbiB domain protein [Actinidia chinensis var. chinensis]